MTSASAEPLLLDSDETAGIATITFNRPSVFNALDVAMADAFRRAVDDTLGMTNLRCIVMTGSGRAFMAGGDVGAFAVDLDGADRVLNAILDSMHPALTALRQADAPVVAAVNGVAAGAGMSLVLAADFVVMHPAAKLALAYDKLAVPPDCGGTWHLARKVGRSKAFELMLLGEVLDADAAKQLGIANVVAGDGDFADQVRLYVRRIAGGPTKAFGQFKRLMNDEEPFPAQIERERQGFVASTRTDDFRSAARAFVTKGPVAFVGR